MKKVLPLILLCLIIVISCNDNKINKPQTENYLCCTGDQFISDNINNLDESLGKIKIIPIFTPNGDGINDIFKIENIDLYPSNSVTLYDLDDNIIFSTDNYGSKNYYGGNLNIKNGSLKYKVIVKNEQTFVQYGYVCVVTEAKSDSTFNLSSKCLLPDFNDPIIIN